MDKQAYHYKKKLKGKTAGTYRYLYPCDPYDNYILWTKQSIKITTPTPESLRRLFTVKTKKNSHPSSVKREWAKSDYLMKSPTTR